MLALAGPVGTLGAGLFSGDWWPTVAVAAVMYPVAFLILYALLDWKQGLRYQVPLANDAEAVLPRVRVSSRRGRLAYMTRRDFDACLQRVLQWLFDHENDGGYARFKVDEAARQSWLYWKGVIPAELTSLLHELKDSCPVTVSAAAHDVVELRLVRSRITSAPGFRGSGIVTLALATDGSGLLLGHEREEPPTQFIEQLRLGVPVTWERGPRPQPL
jgi:hypothetical protein